MAAAPSMKQTPRRIGYHQWMAEGKALFGELPPRDWRFVCPHCGTPQSGQDLADVGVPPADIAQTIGYACIGRFDERRGCDWTLGGLFQIHTLEVIDLDANIQPIFEFYREGCA